MKIGILQCDRVDPQWRERFGDYPGMFTALLRAVDARLDFETFALIDGELPRGDEAVDGWLITGSRAGVYDELPWIAAAGDLLRRLYADGQCLVGICFGHQLLAQVLGGRAAKADAGWGCGRHEYRVLADEHWLQAPGGRFALQVMHQDQVLELPPGATRLASSEFCPNAAYRVGDRVLAFQGHPEFAADYSRMLIENRRGTRLPEPLAAAALADLDAPTDHLRVARWIRDFIAGEAGI